jgi:Fe-S cluster assembly iron-binding protein IscA
MGIAPNAEDSDETITKDGLKVFLDKEANKMLSDATIDFSDEQGFAIDGINQSACQSSCPTSGSSCQ